MSTEQNKALLRRLFEEGVNQNKPGIFEEYIAPDYVNYAFPAPAPGVEGLMLVLGQFRAAFPDLHMTIEDMVAEGDTVVTRGHWTGTHRGVFQGIAPTGKSVRVNYIDVWRIEQGRFVENWVEMDQLGLMQQLGVLSQPA